MLQPIMSCTDFRAAIIIRIEVFNYLNHFAMTNWQQVANQLQVEQEDV